MRLKSLQLQNFRCFPDEAIEFDTYTALVGANNAGKSAIIAAIDIFFRSSPKSIPLTVDDFYRRDSTRELRIVLTFVDLSSAAHDAFSHYVRTNELTFFVSAKIEGGLVSASLHGIRLANPEFAPFFEFTTASEKKTFYNSLTERFDLPNWQNQTQAAEALRAFEEANSSLNKPLPSDDKAFGTEGPVPRLREFIDFVYIPAVKDAGEEAVEARNTAFSRLIDRAVRARLKIEERISAIRQSAKAEIDSIAKEHQEILTTLANKIEGEYKKFNAADSSLHLEWSSLDEKNLQINLPAIHLQVSDDLIRNAIGKFGHGTQRNYIMALLIVSGSYDFSDLQTIIIACEEPELYQHPPQARILANALYSLASNQSQVILTTHSPYFVTAKSFEKIRVVRRTRGQHSKAYFWTIDEHCALVAKAKGEDAVASEAVRALVNQFMQPQINEMFFSPGVIFVEGEEDRALIAKTFDLNGKRSDFLALGLHVVPVNGKGNLINALSIARGFEIPFYVVFDGDMNLAGEKLEKAKSLNKNILSILEFKGDDKTGLFSDHVWGNNFCAWKNSIQDAFDDLTAWEDEKQKIVEELGWTIDRLRKNAMVVEAALERLYKKHRASHLDKLCGAIIENFRAIPGKQS
jgi:predicted ATP-dependent endonuclease of OLD family